jgi:4-aminobutyrate aminotransferase
MSQEKQQGALVDGVKNALPFTVVSSKGYKVRVEDGSELFDLTCGIGVSNLGHCHDGVTKAAQKACETLVHQQMNIMKHQPMVDLISNLANTEVALKAKLDRWFFWNGGTDAVEASIKLARQATMKQNVIVVQGGYHGRTFMSMALTTSGTTYRAGFGPLPGGIFVTPFPYVARGPFADEAMQPAESESSYNYWGCSKPEYAQREVKRCLESFELLLRTQSAPGETACLLVEPVLGEGGYLPAPPGYLEGMHAICKREGILFIADEVQTGFGRTGSMFACDWLDGGIQPDILICAKGLANGFPLSAIGTRAVLAKKQPPGSMGGTYGGNAVACAAANAVFEAFNDPVQDVLNNSNQRAVEVRAFLLLFAQQRPGLVREVRGRGLMIGIEFNPEYGIVEGGEKEKRKPGALAGAICKACWGLGLLILNCGPYDTVRLIPPLTVDKEGLAHMLALFKQGVDVVVQ